MTYYLATTLMTSFDDAIHRTTEALERFSINLGHSRKS